MSDEMTFGLYIRQRRTGKRWNLTRLAEETELSYSHLSRLENDSALPKPDTVVTLADALDGDLKEMLELADCLPKSILEQMAGVKDGNAALKRSADRRGSTTVGKRQLSQAESLARALGLSGRDAKNSASAIVQFLALDGRRRHALTSLIESMDSEEEDGT